MEQVKAIREASQAAYDASSALQSNVQVSWSPLVLLGYLSKDFFLKIFVSVHPLGVSIEFVDWWGHAECTHWV